MSDFPDEVFRPHFQNPRTLRNHQACRVYDDVLVCSVNKFINFMFIVKYDFSLTFLLFFLLCFHTHGLIRPQLLSTINRLIAVPRLQPNSEVA